MYPKSVLKVEKNIAVENKSLQIDNNIRHIFIVVNTSANFNARIE